MVHCCAGGEKVCGVLVWMDSIDYLAQMLIFQSQLSDHLSTNIYRCVNVYVCKVS